MPALLFTENETNFERLFGVPNAGPFVKDAFHEAIVHGRADRVNPGRRGSKAAAHYRAMIEPGGSLTVRTRFTDGAARRPVRRLRRDRRAADGRGRRVLPGHPAAGPGRRPAAGPAPGVCRAALDQAVLSLQRGALARRRPGRSGAAAGAPARAATRTGGTSTTSTS